MYRWVGLIMAEFVLGFESVYIEWNGLDICSFIVWVSMSSILDDGLDRFLCYTLD